MNAYYLNNLMYKVREIYFHFTKLKRKKIQFHGNLKNSNILLSYLLLNKFLFPTFEKTFLVIKSCTTFLYHFSSLILSYFFISHPSVSYILFPPWITIEV